MASITCEGSWFCCGNSWGPCGTHGTGACGTCHSANMQHAWPNASQACWNITRPDQCGISLARRTCGHQHTTTNRCNGSRVTTSIADCGPRTRSFCGERACCGSTCGSNRVMDLTPAAYSRIADLSTGLIPVTVA
ncbi:MAG TPA: septal ring lytic transglycosylase RlpA family protein [Candidatus Stackebrandtia excrementipullorum]|nr:septal ring lytic transglycosylase RlpA family protein [Candidatus Stackebrandtia excrementipullorum]